MKKVMMCLLIGIAAFSLAACGKTESPVSDTTKESVEQEEVLQYKELVDPRGKTLDSTATGDSNPQIVTTLYETDDVVVADFIPTEMGYAVDPTGETDSTAGIQAALYDCWSAGGGTVYLPAGNYAISDTIYIPAYVTLRGDWQDPDEGTEYGTIISVWMEGEDYEGAGAFELSGNAGAIGLTVYYPLQTLDCIIPYPYTFFVEEGDTVTKLLMTIKDITIINGYRGVGTSTSMSHEQLQLDNIKGTFLNCGIQIANSSDVGTVNGVSISTKYWKEAAADCMNTVSPSKIDIYTKQYLTGMRIGDVEWTTFNDISIDNCAIGAQTIKGQRIEFAGSFYDLQITNCEKGFVFNGLDERWGCCIAKSHIEGGLENNTEGKVKLCDVEVVGDIVEYEKNSVIVDEESDLSMYEIDYDASYVKPATNLWVAEISEGLGTDASAELQALLNQAGKTGGIVYVPGGLYCFKKPLTVPAGVELRGATSIPTREVNGISGGNASIGTIFYCYYGDDESCSKEDQAFITLAGEKAGLNGIRIFYPENSSATEQFMSTYAVRGTASGVYVVNSMIVASAYGVDFKDCDNHYISGVTSTCYYNAFRLGGKNGTLLKTLQNGTVMRRTAQSGLENWINDSNFWTGLVDYVLRPKCDYILVDGAENQTIYHAFAYGVKTIINNVNSQGTCAVNIGTDNMGDDCPQFIQNGGSMTVINVLRYNGYSYDLLSGNLNLYNRIAINEVGERTIEKSE